MQITGTQTGEVEEVAVPKESSATPSWALRGQVQQDDEEVIEMRIQIESSGPGEMLADNALGLRVGQGATIRAAVDDWRPVGHYLAEAFVGTDPSAGADVFLSQISFVSHFQSEL